MLGKKLPSKFAGKLRKGIEKATIAVLGYDEKISLSVRNYFETIATRYGLPVYQIRIMITIDETPRVDLFLNGEYAETVSNDHLVRIFASESASLIPGLVKKTEEKVLACLISLAHEYGIDTELLFLRLMVLAGSPVIMLGENDKALHEIKLGKLIEFFL